MQDTINNNLMLGGGRNISLDWLSGLLIVHMILVHISHYAGVQDTDFFNVTNAILFFFMPWFFFKSGMFFKRILDQKDNIRKSFKRLMIPFIVFSLIGEPLYWLHLILTGHDAGMWQWYLFSLKTLLTEGRMQGNSALWFLSSLFVIKVVYNYISVNKNAKILLLVISIVFLCVNHKYSITSIVSITHTIAGMCFFILGDLMRSLQFKRYVCLIALIAYVFVVLVFPISHYSMFSDLVSPGENYYWIYLYALSTILVVNNLLKQLPDIIYKIIPLQIIGRQSMSYYVLHALILMMCKIIFTEIFHLEQWLYFGVQIFICIVTLPILAKLFQLPKYKKIVGA